MSECGKDVLAKSKYNQEKAIELRGKIHLLTADLASRQYECLLLDKAIADLQAEYRKFLSLNEKGVIDENVK